MHFLAFRNICFFLVGLACMTTALQAQQSISNAVETCDRLAAQPFMSHNPAGVTGVYDIELATIDQARSACEQAVEEEPLIPRLLFQLGRVRQAEDLKTTACNDFESASGSGLESATIALAWCFITKDNGRAQNIDVGANMIRGLAETGNPLAQFYLALFFLSDELPIAGDAEKRFLWIKRSADSGYPPAIRDLAMIYGTGGVVAADIETALDLAGKAANLGEVGAQKSLALTYLGNAAVPRDCALASRYVEMALTNPRYSKGSKTEAQEIKAKIDSACSVPENLSTEDLQRELKRHGFYSGPIDGDWGPGSRRAGRNAQRHFGEQETGEEADVRDLYGRMHELSEPIIASGCTLKIEIFPREIATRPGPRSERIARAEPGDYRVLDQTLYNWAGKKDWYFKIAVRGQQGWLRYSPQRMTTTGQDCLK